MVDKYNAGSFLVMLILIVSFGGLLFLVGKTVYVNATHSFETHECLDVAVPQNGVPVCMKWGERKTGENEVTGDAE